MLITNLSNKIHNLRKSCCFVAQNGLISPLAILDTINCYMSYLPSLKWNKWILIQFWKQCVIRKHNGHTLRWRYDYSHTPRHLVTASLCFRGLFFSGTHCILVIVILRIGNKRNNSRKAFRKAFAKAFWLWVLKRVSTLGKGDKRTPCLWRTAWTLHPLNGVNLNLGT